MATLGDLNPNLYKKSQLQLENEAKAQQQAQQDAVNRQSKDYIGTGVTPDQIRVTQAPKPFYEPSMNLSGIQENSYMGPTATMGQLNPALNQKTQLQLENEARQQKMTAQPEVQQNPQENEAMRQARARNESMINSGIVYGQQSTTPAQYDQNALNAQSGYGKTYGGRQNIAPELFTNRVASKVDRTDTQLDTLRKQQAAAAAKYKAIGGMITNPSNPLYGQQINALDDLKAANKAVTDYESGTGAQKQAEFQQQTEQLAGREASELAQNLGNMGNTGQQPQGYGIPSTGDATADMNIAMSNQMMRENEQLINDDKIRNDNLLRNQLINSYMQTNISDLGYNKDALNKMTTEQLMSLGSAEGLDMSTAVKDKLSAFGKLQIENEKLNRDFELADVEMTRRQMERQLGRSITEQEDFNTQQDTKLRRMLGMFGGGKVQDLAGNMAVMDAQQKGITALADLRADYGDRLDSLGRTYNKISSSHALAIKGIEYETNNAIETAFVGLQNKIDGYITAGVTNEKELNKVAMQGKKEFLKTYMEETSKGADRIQKQNETMFNQIMKLQEAQREEDKNMSSMYGVIFNGGKPVLDQNGMEVPTFDNMKFMREGDELRSTQEGIIYENGAPKLDSRGRTIPTLTARNADRTYESTQRNSDRTYDLQVSQENRQMSKDEYDRLKTYAEATGDYSVLGYGEQSGGYNVSGQPGQQINISGSKYPPVVQENGTVMFTPKLDASGKIVGTDRRECGEYVNDAIGTKMFGNEISQKIKQVKTQVPTAGSAFVQSTGNQYGHVGLVEGITATDEQGRPTQLQISDSNYKSRDTFDRTLVNITYDQSGNPVYTRTGAKPGKMRIEGFTNSFAGAQPVQAGPKQASKQVMDYATMYERNGNSFTNLDVPKAIKQQVVQYLAQKPQAVGTGVDALMSGIPAQAKTRVDQLLGGFDNEPMVKEYQVVQNAMDFVRELPNKTQNPSDDQALIYAFAKIMDPNSVVREGEYATVQKYAQKWADQYGGSFNMALNGTGFLSEDARNNIKKTLEGKYKASSNSYKSFRGDYVKRIDKAANKTIGNELLQDYAYLGAISQPTTSSTPQSQWGFTQMATKVPLRAPDGSPIYVPANEVQSALDAGATY